MQGKRKLIWRSTRDPLLVCIEEPDGKYTVAYEDPDSSYSSFYWTHSDPLKAQEALMKLISGYYSVHELEKEYAE